MGHPSPELDTSLPGDVEDVGTLVDVVPVCVVRYVAAIVAGVYLGLQYGYHQEVLA